jgi:hypothetical protein
LQTEVKYYAIKELDFDPRVLPLFWPSPIPEHALDFNDGVSFEHHPCPKNLMVDWYIPGPTPWTRSAAAVLARKFCMQHENGSFPEIRRKLEEDHIAAMFVEYILLMKRHYVREVENLPVGMFCNCGCDCNEEEENKSEESSTGGSNRPSSEGEVVGVVRGQTES